MAKKKHIAPPRLEVQCAFYIVFILLNDKVTGDGFPELPPGETVLTVSGVVPKIKVMPRWCCL